MNLTILKQDKQIGDLLYLFYRDTDCVRVTAAITWQISSIHNYAGVVMTSRVMVRCGEFRGVMIVQFNQVNICRN